MEQVDIVVVGAGLAGLATAWHLAPHASVLVVEQGPQPGAEATAQNAGMVRRMGEDPCERALSLRTAAWLAEPGDDWSDEAPSRVTGAVLALRDEPFHLHDAAAHVRAAGGRVESLDRPGDVAPALAGSPVSRAWYLPDERVADAHALLAGYLRGLRRMGGAVRCGVAVTGLATDGGRCLGVATSGGPIAAGAVVLAAGAWSARLAATGGLQRRLFPLRRTLLQSAPHDLSSPDHPWTWVDDAGIYVRPEAGGWLCSPCDEALDPPGEGPGSAGPVDDLARALASDKLARWMPALGSLRWRGGWTGLRTFAPDRRPVLGADPALPGLWWAAGLGGFGVTCCHGVGEVVSAWMRGEPTGWLRPEDVSPARPMMRRWPIRPTGSIHDTRLVDGAVQSA